MINRVNLRVFDIAKQVSASTHLFNRNVYTYFLLCYNFSHWICIILTSVINWPFFIQWLFLFHCLVNKPCLSFGYFINVSFILSINLYVTDVISTDVISIYNCNIVGILSMWCETRRKKETNISMSLKVLICYVLWKYYNITTFA